MSESMFQFRFRRLLELRERQKKMAGIELAEMEKKVSAQKARIEEKSAEKKEAMQRQREAARAADLLMISEYSAHLRRLNEQIHNGREELKELIRSRERSHAGLMEAARACQALENYRDRKKTEFVSGLERLEETGAEDHTVNTMTGPGRTT